MSKLKAAEINKALKKSPDWSRAQSSINKTYVFKDFPAAIRFVNKVAEVAEEAQHHPDIDIRWNKVTLVLTTHDEGGLTKKDLTLARKFDLL